MRVLYLGAPVDAPEPDLPLADRFRLLGLNAGNLLIGNSLHRALKTSHYLSRLHVALSFLSPEAVNEQFDVIVIPASNFIGSYTDMSGFADFIDNTKLPCVMVGLGAQAASFETFVPPLRKGTQRFLSIVSERSKSIGVRGNYSAEVMNRLGYKNVVACGCPSLFRNLCPELKINKRAVKSAQEIRVVLNGSRNVVRHSFAPDSMRRIESSLISGAITHKYAYILQNEEPEIGIATGEFRASEEILYALRASLDDVGLTDVDERLYFDCVRDGFRFFFDLESWDEYIRKFDFSLGSRFHGNIIALTNGIPAFIFAHDARTKELCELAEIPHRAVSDIAKLDAFHFYTRSSFDAFESRYPVLYRQYAEFLSSNGLQHRLNEVAPDPTEHKQSSRSQRIVVEMPASAAAYAHNKGHPTVAQLKKLASEILDQNARDRELLMGAEAKLRELEAAARFAQKVIDERGERIAELEASLRPSKEENTQTKARLQTTETEIEKLRVDLAFSQRVADERGDHIANVETLLNVGADERAMLQKHLDGAIVEIDKLRGAVDFAQKVVDARGARIEELELTLQRKDVAMLARIESMEAALADYHNSLSWKVSSRLRAMRRGMGEFWLWFRAALSRRLFRMRFSRVGFALTMAMRALRHRSRIPLRN